MGPQVGKERESGKEETERERERERETGKMTTRSERVE